MKKKLAGILIAGIIYSCGAKAQTQECPFNYGHFTTESDVFLFGDKVNVRQSPSVQSALIGQKGIGTPVTVVEQSDEQFTLGGYSTNWYKISYTEGPEMFTGYVYGGLLSMVTGALPREDGGTDQLLYSITSWSKEKEFTSTVRIVRDGVLLTSLDFPPIASGFFDAGVFGHGVCLSIENSHGFKGIRNVIRLQYIYEACGYENGEILLLWDGSKLTYLAKASQVVEAGVFHYSYTLTFPDEEGGKPNTLKIVQEMVETEWEGESEKVSSDVLTLKTFVWDGNAVNEMPEETEKKQ